MPSSPTVSVCVPTYNRSGVLGECLESILRQSFTDYELVILDNCSTDSTPEIVRKFKDHRIRYLRNRVNIGQIRNLNRCLEVATGEYICVFHDDDLYDPQILEKQLDIFSRYEEVGLVHTAAWLLTEAGYIRKLHRVSRRNYMRGGIDSFLNYLRFSHDIVFSTVMVRRRCYQELGEFDSKYLCADFDMWLRIALNYGIAYIAEPLAGYRIHSNTASKAMSARQWFQEYFEIFDKSVKMAMGTISGIQKIEGVLRIQASRNQAKRSRIEAVAQIANGEYQVAADYIQAASRLDSSILGKVCDNVLFSLLNRVGQVAFGLVRGLRSRFQSICFSRYFIGKHYIDICRVNVPRG